MRLTVRRHDDGGVLWVDAHADGQTVSLGGMCRYWWTDTALGGYHCPEHPEVGQVGWVWTGARFEPCDTVPDGATHAHGSWLDDEQWRKARMR